MTHCVLWQHMVIVFVYISHNQTKSLKLNRILINPRVRMLSHLPQWLRIHKVGASTFIPCIWIELQEGNAMAMTDIGPVAMSFCEIHLYYGYG